MSRQPQKRTVRRRYEQLETRAMLAGHPLEFGPVAFGESVAAAAPAANFQAVSSVAAANSFASGGGFGFFHHGGFGGEGYGESSTSLTGSLSDSSGDTATITYQTGNLLGTKEAVFTVTGDTSAEGTTVTLEVGSTTIGTVTLDNSGDGTLIVPVSSLASVPASGSTVSLVRRHDNADRRPGFVDQHERARESERFAQRFQRRYRHTQLPNRQAAGSRGRRVYDYRRHQLRGNVGFHPGRHDHGRHRHARQLRQRNADRSRLVALGGPASGTRSRWSEPRRLPARWPRRLRPLATAAAVAWGRLEQQYHIHQLVERRQRRYGHDRVPKRQDRRREGCRADRVGRHHRRGNVSDRDDQRHRRRFDLDRFQR